LPQNHPSISTELPSISLVVRLRYPALLIWVDHRGVVLDRETYRENALRCLLAASKARDPALRFTLLNLAITYRRLANNADRRPESGIAHSGDQNRSPSTEPDGDGTT